MQKKIVGPFANAHYLMLGQKNFKNVVVKKTIYISFFQKILWYFFVNWIKFAETEDFLYDRHQLFLVRKFLQNEFIGGIVAKTMRILNFKRSGTNIFSASWKSSRGLVVN